MNVIQSLRKSVGLKSPLRRTYHVCRGFIAFALSGNPAKGMYVIGVTGTKGKTTTSTLIATALESAGKKVLLITTAQVWMAGERSENHTKMTMDSPFRLWRLVRRAKKLGVTHIVLETSSHGIYYSRNLGIRYDAVVLTNISQDHLDLHETMEHYVATKAKIFAQEPHKLCILPRDCAYFPVFAKQAGDDVITYSMSHVADYQVTDIQTSSEEMQIIIKETRNSEFITLNSHLVGIFNAENLLTAYSTLRTIGIEKKILQDAWRDFSGAPGRMERVPNTLGLTILVDYAHTEASLRSVLETIKMQNDGFIKNSDKAPLSRGVPKDEAGGLVVNESETPRSSTTPLDRGATSGDQL